MDFEQLWELKLYMHVDHDDDDALIIKLHDAAAEYLLDQCGVPQNGTALVWLATAGLTLHWYDNRAFEGTDIGLPTGLRTTINGLKTKYGGDCYI